MMRRILLILCLFLFPRSFAFSQDLFDGFVFEDPLEIQRVHARLTEKISQTSNAGLEPVAEWVFQNLLTQTLPGTVVLIEETFLEGQTCFDRDFVLLHRMAEGDYAVVCVERPRTEDQNVAVVQVKRIENAGSFREAVAQGLRYNRYLRYSTEQVRDRFSHFLTSKPPVLAFIGGEKNIAVIRFDPKEEHVSGYSLSHTARDMARLSGGFESLVINGISICQKHAPKNLPLENFTAIATEVQVPSYLDPYLPVMQGYRKAALGFSIEGMFKTHRHHISIEQAIILRSFWEQLRGGMAEKPVSAWDVDRVIQALEKILPKVRQESSGKNFEACLKRIRVAAADFWVLEYFQQEPVSSFRGIPPRMEPWLSSEFRTLSQRIGTDDFDWNEARRYLLYRTRLLRRVR